MCHCCFHLHLANTERPLPPGKSKVLNFLGQSGPFISSAQVRNNICSFFHDDWLQYVLTCCCCRTTTIGAAVATVEAVVVAEDWVDAV